MNCVPGDLAAIVRADIDKEHIGKLVTCIEWENDRWGGGWITWPILKSVRGSVIRWHDGDLKPIRDPGDDAVHETLLRLPAPKRAEVTS